MLPSTHIITFQHPEGGVGCHALCFSTPFDIRQHWEFVAQDDTLEAVLHAVDNYPPQYGIKVSDMTFMEPKLFSSLYQKADTSDDLYRVAQLIGVPLRQWLSDNGRFLTNVRPFYATAELVDNAHWVIDADSITFDPLSQFLNDQHDVKWVKVTHRGIHEANEGPVSKKPMGNVVPFSTKPNKVS